MHTNNTFDKQLKRKTLPSAGLHVKGVPMATATHTSTTSGKEH